ncbi:D-alanyl-D-alanine carboxypeptidase family protein [Candidatus Neomarinimicrobiota bacterium]
MGTSASAQSFTTQADSASLFPIAPIEYLTGQFLPSKALDFALLPYSMTDGSTVYLRTTVVDSLARLIAAAAQAGVKLWAVSGVRTNDRQKKIWERRFKVETSANATQAQTDAREMAACRILLKKMLAPGTSRHHWGTDVDLVTTESRYWHTRAGKKQIKWLTENGENFGFYLVYSRDRKSGVTYEPWHWSFAPLAKPLLKYYLEHVKTTDLGDFMGRGCLDKINWKAELMETINGNLK